MLFIDAKNDLEEKMDKIGSKFRKIDQHLSLVRALKAWAAFRAEEAHAAAEMTRLELTFTLQHMWRFLMRQWFERWRERAGLFATGQRALMYKGALSYALQSLLLNDTMHWHKVLRRLVGKWRIMARTQRRRPRHNWRRRAEAAQIDQYESTEWLKSCPFLLNGKTQLIYGENRDESWDKLLDPGRL